MRYDFKAAIFDLDGTLINTEPRSRWAWTKLFSTHGVPLREDELTTFSGRRGLEVLAERLHLFPGQTAEALFEEAMSYWGGTDSPDSVPVPGAVELVREITAQSVPAAIVSSARRAEVDDALKVLDLRDSFQTIITAEDVVEGKPNPEGILYACEILDVPSSETIVFEDAPSGITAAKRAGAACLAITTTRSEDALTEADVIVQDLRDVEWPPGPFSCTEYIGGDTDDRE